jgi:hypothetical protein
VTGHPRDHGRRVTEVGHDLADPGDLRDRIDRAEQHDGGAVAA